MEQIREGRIEANITDIIVTARRKEEQIQDVPQAIQAVSGATLEKLNLFNFDDLSKIAAGVSLTRAGNVTTVRGVSFNPTAQTNPTVSMYINDAPVNPALVFQSVFDVEQFEILRGPQGTMRGQSAPTGAITITTRKPNLYRHGASAMATFTDRDGRTLQGSANIPIIEGVLGIRFAGMADHNNNGGVRSLNSIAADGGLNKPYGDTNAFRVSARFEPVDNLSVNVMYQNLFTRSRSYGGAIVGNGAPAASIKSSNYALPFVRIAGSNGPVINEGQRFSVAENGDFSRGVQEVATGDIEYRLAGQKLTFVGAWSRSKGLTSLNYGDTPNLIAGDFPGRSTISTLNRWSQELRLSSEEYLFNGLLEYVIGAYHQVDSGQNDGNNGLTFLAGAFGDPRGAPIARTPNLDYSTTSKFKTDNHTEEWSYFGTLTLHFGEKTELSGGIRFINNKKDNLRINSQSSGYQASTAPCPAVNGFPSRTYTGVCDIFRPGSITSTLPDVQTKKPTVYSASLSHRWTPDLLTYFNFGTSWRPGPTQGNLINGTNDPTLTALATLKDETSQSFEVGIKSSWFDHRLNLNLAAYHQKYENYVYSVLTGIPYVADTGVPGTSPSVTLAVPMNSNIDAKIDGVDFDFQFAATKRWNIGGGVSWAYGRFNNALIPCWDGNFDGIPDTNSAVLIPPNNVQLFRNAGVMIAQCRVSGRSALQPTWNGTLRSDYTQPIGNDMDAFITGTLTYTPKNPYANASYLIPSYALMNLNVGVRNYQAGWEFQLFAKNLFNNQAVIDRGLSATTSTPDLTSTFGGSGYRGISYLAPRELGITFRYAFGSR
ncbi:MAG TPA: TonB-dependent receptor [Sphingobium sp.]|uniref:TonB-dependent receptor n=1 Tax=Sphingobium sp. TaxID=1912891 RepID=UPI002ED0921C